MQKEKQESQICDGQEDRIQTYWQASFAWNYSDKNLSPVDWARLNNALARICIRDKELNDTAARLTRQLQEEVRQNGPTKLLTEQ